MVSETAIILPQHVILTQNTDIYFASTYTNGKY